MLAASWRTFTTALVPESPVPVGSLLTMSFTTFPYAIKAGVLVAFDSVLADGSLTTIRDWSSVAIPRSKTCGRGWDTCWKAPAILEHLWLAHRAPSSISSI
ncbi:hypothetical protein BV25DRAFT_1921189 [Artomyces pyxidatus]|uniref:Uncharacterized protein n=1 Tax=Artomyces pyxidatus TaxID=48021 RepID=A0ACB8SIZ0_9AGAM|nr:hypothetical protein BV25DRAFT_1921189 [Artomyces pyxidatus]